jgi:hypothetical protein
MAFGTRAPELLHAWDMSNPSDFFASAPADPAAYQRWLDGIVSLAEGARERKVHSDTLKREHERGRIKLVRRSKRLWGIRRRDVLLVEG